MARSASVSGRLRRTLATIGGGLSIIISGWIGLVLIERHVVSLRAAEERIASQHAEAAAVAVGLQIERTLEAVSTLHRLGKLLCAFLEQQDTNGADLIASHLRTIVADRQFGTIQVAIINRDGMLVWSTVRDAPAVNLADREHFRVHLEGRKEPFASAPLVGRASGRASVQLTRPITTENGQFSGVVVVSVDPYEISARLGEVLINATGTAALLRHDGVVLARSTAPDQWIGSRYADAEWRQLLPRILASPDRPTFGTGLGLDGSSRIFGAQAVAAWPLVVVFSLPIDMFAEAEQRARLTLQLRLGAALVVCCILYFLLDALLSRHAARRAARKAETARQETLALIEALPGAAYRGRVHEDGNWEILQLSTALTRIAGRRAKLEELFRVADPRAIGVPDRHALLQRVWQDGHGADEYAVRSGQESPTWLRDEIRVARRDVSGYAEVVGIVTDITAERQIRAQAISAAKLSTLGEMATGIAHELAQPCAAICLMADSAHLETERRNFEGRERISSYLEKISMQAMRLREIVDHFRIFARQNDEGPSMVDLNEAVQGALMIVGGSLHASGIMIENDVLPDLPKVSANLIPLEQVLVNIMINARDAMENTPARDRRIKISTCLTHKNERIAIEIRDFGSGIPEQYQEKIFQPFFTTKPPGKGTGLGLAIAYTTIRGFGGEITLRNAPGGGVVVTIDLPAQPAPTSPFVGSGSALA